VRIGVVRSGLVEARHDVTVVAAAAGRIVERIGDDESPFYLRSALKPFQTAVAQRMGAGLGPEQTAVVSASHGGQPVHLAYVRAILAEAGLDETSLRCPPARPLGAGADRTAARLGDLEERPIYHNCSGKHAGMLRACAARGWPLDYTDPGHPLQKEILDYAADVCGGDPRPVGVDGCGVPTVRSTVAGLALAFARLAADAELAEVYDAMHRFAALTSDGGRAEAVLACWADAAVKGGAMACIGLAHRSGVGIAAKCWTGQKEPAVMGVVAMADRLGLVGGYPREMLSSLAAPPVLGGGRRVGSYEVVG
jgi:L-asparaginase II